MFIQLIALIELPTYLVWLAIEFIEQPFVVKGEKVPYWPTQKAAHPPCVESSQRHVCNFRSNLNGTCYTASECVNKGGQAGGNCAAG